MMGNKKVLYITNVPSPYRVNYFNELSKYCDLTVIYERDSASDRDIKWKEEDNKKYNIIFLDGYKFKTDFIVSNGIKKHLKNNKYDFIIFCNFASPSGILGINYCIKHNIKYCIEGDGAFYLKKSLKDIIKKRLLKNALYCFSTCNNLDEYYLNLGVSKNNIKRYRFTSLSNDEIINNSSLTNNIDELKNKLHLNYKKILLFVGQFIKRKGIDILLESFSKLPSDGIGLVIIGGEPIDEYIEIMNKYNLKNIHFYTFMNKKEMDDYFRISNLFILPTREDIWGLVVNEALSYGVPVITTDRCNAGLELIKNDYNGYIVKSNDIDELSIAINNLLSGNGSLRDNCLKSIEQYTIENMVKDHLEVFNTDGKE